MAELTFWGDESGAHGDGPFVLAGYLGPDDSWNRVQDEWHDVLHSEGRPIDYFHMRECFKLEKQFAGFTRFQADRKKNALIDVLRNHLRKRELIEFAAILDWDVYRRSVHGPLKETHHSPYFFTLHPIMAEIAKHLWTDPALAARGRVDFFFDSQAVLIEGDVETQFYNVKGTVHESYARALGDVAFRDDQINYPLQAADLLAWQVHRRELNLAEDGRQPRKDYLRLRNVAGGKLMRCREDSMTALSERVAAGLRAGVWQ